MRLQAMNPTKFKVEVSPKDLGEQIGNAMSVNVIERILVRALEAAELVAPKSLTDRWLQGDAQRELQSTQGQYLMSLRPIPKEFYESQSSAEELKSNEPPKKELDDTHIQTTSSKKAKKKKSQTKKFVKKLKLPFFPRSAGQRSVCGHPWPQTFREPRSVPRTP